MFIHQSVPSMPPLVGVEPPQLNQLRQHTAPPVSRSESLIERGARGADLTALQQVPLPALPKTTAQPQHTGFVDPATRSAANGQTRQLALQQTMSARDLLYNPGEALRTELGLAAGRAHDMISGLGDLQDPLGGHLFGAEGLMPGQNAQALLDTLKRMHNDIPPGRSNATAKDRSILIALMGDIGAILSDSTTGVERTKDQDKQLKELIPKLLNLATSPETIMAPTAALGGSGTIGPAKKQERIKPPNEQPPRTGIHNLGKEADDQLGIAQSGRLLPSRWDVSQLKTERVLQTTEPLVAHMSGTQAETLAVWDMLRGEKTPYTGVMENLRAQPQQANDPMAHLPDDERNARYARAAGTAAFLISNGYHSAVEVLGGTLAYTGQDGQSVVGPGQDAAHLFGQGAATELVSELMSKQRSPRT